MTYACPAWEFTTDTHLTKLQRPAKQGAPHYGNLPQTPIYRNCSALQNKVPRTMAIYHRHPSNETAAPCKTRCPTLWQFTTDTHLTKLQRPAKQGAPHYGNLPRRTPTREVHVAFKIPHLHDFITKLCKQRAEVIQKHDNKKRF